MKQKLQASENKGINKTVRDYCRSAWSGTVPISGETLQARVKQRAKTLCKNYFEAPNGRLQTRKKKKEVSKSFRTESITKSTTTIINTQ
jgi:hypothetical protein